MDKILLIDLLNQVWRANISFFPKKEHIICLLDCQIPKHDSNKEHCSCGSDWVNGICTQDISDEFIIIYNFFRSLRMLVELFSPNKCFFVLEGHPQFRYDLYADYKSNRIIKKASRVEEQDKVFKSKNEIIRLLAYLPVTFCRAAQYEADDTIATLCENMKDEDITVISNDSDYIQLLQRGYKNCKIFNPMKKVFMESPPYSYVVWKSLNGDKSDNIPALVKPKMAIDLAVNPTAFKQFLSLEENRANFSINQQLINLKSVPLEEIVFSEGIANFEILKEEFKRMSFYSLINNKSWEKFVSTFDCISY